MAEVEQAPFAVKDGKSGGQAYDERLIAIHAMRADGLTLQAIGDTFGITRERVRQLLVMSNGPTADQVRDYRRQRTAAQAQSRQLELTAWLKERPGATLHQARVSFGWSENELASAMTPDAHRLAVQVRDGAAYRQYSNEQTLTSIRAAWALSAHTAAGLSYKRYQDLMDRGDITGPSAVRVVQIFGSWSRALDLAGVPAGATPRRDYSSHWSDGEILAAVGRYLNDPDTTGSFSGWDEWRRSNAPEAPSGALVRNRLGKWSQVKAQALVTASSVS